jgi:hypothetical protein
MASMKQLQNHPRVEYVDDERGYGNGVFVTLKRGWSIDPLRDSRVFAEDTITQAMDSVRWLACPFEGPFES